MAGKCPIRAPGHLRPPDSKTSDTSWYSSDEITARKGQKELSAALSFYTENQRMNHANSKKPIPETTETQKANRSPEG
jgi:hypothetical protein